MATCALENLFSDRCHAAPYEILSIFLFTKHFDLFFFVFRVTLYPAYSKVGRRNLVLRYSVYYLPTNFRRIACGVAELNIAL